MDTDRIKQIRQQAILLATENKRAEPGITKVYWFPDEQEIRLLELETGIPPSPGNTVEPFRFAPSPIDQITAPSGIALIRPDEFGKLDLPEEWGGWNSAEELEIA